VGVDTYLNASIPLFINSFTTPNIIAEKSSLKSLLSEYSLYRSKLAVICFNNHSPTILSPVILAFCSSECWIELINSLFFATSDAMFSAICLTLI